MDAAARLSRSSCELAGTRQLQHSSGVSRSCRKVSGSVRLRLKLLPLLPPCCLSAKTGTVAALAPVSGCAISCNHAGTEASPPLAPAPGCAISCSHCGIGCVCVSAARDCEYIRRNGTLHSSVALLDQRLPWDLFSHFRNSMGGLNHVLPGSQSSNNCRVVQANVTTWF